MFGIEINFTVRFREREREREPGESGMSGEKSRTRRVAGADGFGSPDSLLRRWHLSGGGGSSGR